MRSSCAGFSNMFCLADSPASVTSDSWPIDAAPHYFLFAERSYSHIRSPFPQPLPRPRFCGSVPAVKVRCALSSDSRQTNSTEANAPRLGALTPRSTRLLVAHPVSLRRRGAIRVSAHQNQPIPGPSYSMGIGDSLRHREGASTLTLGESSFPSVLGEESAFKPHS